MCCSGALRKHAERVGRRSEDLEVELGVAVEPAVVGAELGVVVERLEAAGTQLRDLDAVAPDARLDAIRAALG